MKLTVEIDFRVDFETNNKTMKNAFLSRFTPSLMSAETLEAMFVKRHKLAEDLVEVIRVSATTDNKHFRLLVGPRGIGKTHLISLIYHRVSKMDDLRDKLLIGWLVEEEWGVTSFLDLLLRIFRALEKEYPTEYNAKLNQQVEALYQLSAHEAEYRAASLLREFVGKRVLLLLIENLDDLFDGLGDIGQKQLRAYIQNYSFLTILATAQSLFKAVRLQDYPFYGFFYSDELEKLNLDEAVELLAHIAKLSGDRELESFILTPTGRSRIKAIHHLAAGNPRVYVIFSQFLTRKSLDELVEPFMQTLDELTPYYQARMLWVSPQQRKIIEFLVERRGTATVKEIAQRCFISHQTASSQLKDLRDKGYVNSESIGRESFYELQEPLMRFCLEVKKQRGEQIGLIVDFLRIWYTRTELQQLLGLERRDFSNELISDGLALIDGSQHEQSDDKDWQPIEALPADSVRERGYVMAALQTEEEEEDPRIAAYWGECENCIENTDYESALKWAEKLVEISGHAEYWSVRGGLLYELKRYEEAVASCKKAVALDPNSAKAWSSQAYVLDNLKRYEEALASYDKAVALDPNFDFAWANRGNVLNNLKRYEEALESYDKAIALDPNYAWAWANRGYVLNNLKRYEEALESYDKAIALDPNYAWAWANRGYVLNNLKRYEEELESFDKAVALDPNYAIAWRNRGLLLSDLNRKEEALESYDKAIELGFNRADAWFRRGLLLSDLNRKEEALESYDKAIALYPNFAGTWIFRGLLLSDLNRKEEALESYDKAIELDPNDPIAWYNRGLLLYDLNRKEEALESYDKAIELDPNYVYAWNNRGSVLYGLNRKEEALQSCDQAIALDPNFALAWGKRGGVLDDLNRKEEALQSYDKAIELDPNDAGAWCRRGDVLSDLNRKEEALESYDQAIELRPDHKINWQLRAFLLADLKHYEKALVSYDKAIELEPNDGFIWYSRGWMLFQLGQYNEALTSCDQAIALGEQDWVVLFIRSLALLALNHWDKGIFVLENALNRFANGAEPDADDNKLIISILFNSTQDATIWKSLITTLIELYDKYKFIATLGQGLVQNIPELMSEMVSDKAAQTWLEVWRKLVGDVSEFVIPLRLLNAGVRYKITKGDRRVLLELPIEERNLLQPLLETETSGH